MKSLVEQVNDLKKDKISKEISKRLKEFEDVGGLGGDRLFEELCFCLMTANFRADKCLEIQEYIGSGFLTWDLEKLRGELKSCGHRFWPQRAERIVIARGLDLGELKGKSPVEARDWLALNVNGLGLKEASHFLRNIGYKDLAIIDFHIIDLLKREGLVSFDRKKMSLTRGRYLEIENVLRDLADELEMSLAELDLYLWYVETGKVLK